MAETKNDTPLNRVVSGEITPADAMNLLRILNRVSYTGMAECQVAVLLGIKLKNIAGDLYGKDLPTAD